MMKFEPAFTNISATTVPNRHVMETWLNWISHKLVAFWWLKKHEYCSSLTVYGVVHTFYLSFLCLNLEMSLIWLVGRGGRGEFILFKCYSVTPQASVCSVLLHLPLWALSSCAKERDEEKYIMAP